MGFSMAGGGDSGGSGYQPPATQPYSPPPPPPNPVRPPQQQRPMPTVGSALAGLRDAPAATALPSIMTAARQLFGGGGQGRQSSPVYGGVSQNRVQPPLQRQATSLPSPRPAPMPPPSPVTVRQPFGNVRAPPRRRLAWGRCNPARSGRNSLVHLRPLLPPRSLHPWVQRRVRVARHRQRAANTILKPVGS
jgi:hypothetical protein